MYRKSDIRLLQDIFDRPSNDIAILYGSDTMDLTGLIRDLVRDRDHLYYKACDVDEKTQRRLFATALRDQTKTPIFPDDDYEKLILSHIGGNSGTKKMIVLDGFSCLIRENPTFINFLASLMNTRCRKGTVMFLLADDDIRWVENDMLRLIGRRSSDITAVVKINGYSPSEFAECFPKMPLREVIGIYSLIGGNAAYYDDITDDTTMRDVVMMQLEKWGRAGFDLNAYLPGDIREPAVYNAILVNLASGVAKLGDIYDATGIERAKLSVYLKKLVESGTVEKAVSADVGRAADVRKGLYRISDRMVRFYYRFVFPHLSTLRLIGSDRFYRRFIEHGLYDLLEEAYPLFCMEHIRWLEREGRLNFRVSSVEEFFDRSGAIDFVIVAAGGSVIACACNYDTSHMGYRAYEEIKAAVRRNRLMCDNIWLFSAGGFDQKLTMSAAVTPGVKLIDGKDQRLR